MTLTTLSTTHLQNTLAEVTRRIVETARPLRIVLFGSAVHGNMTPDSDLDLLVVVRAPIHRRRMAQEIQRNLHGVDLPVDVVVVTEEDVHDAGRRYSVVRPALEEGQIVYEAG